MEIDSTETRINNLTIKSSDGVEYNTDSNISCMSGYISNFLKDNQSQNLLISLDSIKSSELNLIIQFCEHHKFNSPSEIIKPLQYNELSKCVSDAWDAEFISGLDFDKVTELLIAAEFLMINSLTDLCYARMALYFRGK
jgi:S-phase kinase-associated protein 1